MTLLLGYVHYPTPSQPNQHIFSGQHCQVYYPEACDSTEGPTDRKPSLAVWYLVQSHACCVQGRFTVHIILALVSTRVF